MRTSAAKKPPTPKATTTTAAIDPVRDDGEYQAFLGRLQRRFLTQVADGRPIFTTDTPDLFQSYVKALPSSLRQHHTCHTCRRFVDTYGGLVTIDETGHATSILWDVAEAPREIVLGIGMLAALVDNQQVTGVFYDTAKVWGTPVTTTKGTWTHLAVTPPTSLIFSKATQTPHQASAEKREDLSNVLRALAEFPLSAINQAISLLETDALYRSEKCLGVANWLKGLHEMRSSTKNRVARDNLMWLAIATAPAGFCHPRSSMIGTLLEDIIAGLPFETVSKRFADKMHPLQYQRPQAAPKAGNIAQAEKVIEQLRAAGALERRFARLTDIDALWLPRPPRKSAPQGDGVFSHLKPRGSAPDPVQLRRPPVTMTWEKFCRTVLIEAESIEHLVPSTGHFCALVTATNPDAPPILQWDSLEHRNPVSWYVYSGGSLASRWGLRANQFCRVAAVTYQPSSWGGGFEHQGNSVIFILDGARDSGQAGLGLFPEILRSEFHGIRATIEAFSIAGKIADADGASACGVRLQKGAGWNATFRVISKGIAVDYKLDRWD